MATTQRARRPKTTALKTKSGTRRRVCGSRNKDDNGKVRKRELDAAQWVSTVQFARAAGVTDEAIRYAIKGGRIDAIVRSNRYRLNLDTELPKFLATFTRRGIAAHKQLEADAPGVIESEDGITEQNAAQRERMYKARKAKLDYLQSMGELIPAATVMREWQVIAQGVQGRLLSIPDRVSTIVQGMKHRDIHKVLTDEIRHALAVLSDSIKPGT